MRIDRTQRTLPSADAVQDAYMVWLEMLISRDRRTYRVIGGDHDEENRFCASVWADHDMVGAVLGTEVFRGGEWLLTTYDLGSSEIETERGYDSHRPWPARRPRRGA